jgi:hypothetical protein
MLTALKAMGITEYAQSLNHLVSNDETSWRHASVRRVAWVMLDYWELYSAKPLSKEQLEQISSIITEEITSSKLAREARQAGKAKQVVKDKKPAPAAAAAAAAATTTGSVSAALAKGKAPKAATTPAVKPKSKADTPAAAAVVATPKTGRVSAAIAAKASAVDDDDDAEVYAPRDEAMPDVLRLDDADNDDEGSAAGSEETSVQWMQENAESAACELESARDLIKQLLRDNGTNTALCHKLKTLRNRLDAAQRHCDDVAGIE